MATVYVCTECGETFSTLGAGAEHLCVKNMIAGLTEMHECPWGCPFNIFPEDVEYHRQWHRDQGEDPDVRGATITTEQENA